ncbi:pyrroline-5-carboxylate reductase [Rhodococcus koreensis]
MKVEAVTSTAQLTGETLCVLGAGAMGQAIVSGLLASAAAPRDIRITCRTTASASRLVGDARVTAYAVESTSDANRLAVQGASIIVLAVKPSAVAPCLNEIAPILTPGAIVVSLAAGLSTASIQQRLPKHVSVLRAIPNTPASVGKSVTAISAGTPSSSGDLARVHAVFAQVGSVFVVPESQLNAVTAISGSGPAYVFYLIEQLTAAATRLGFTPTQAATLVRDTFAGAVELLFASEYSVADLRRQVTSPGGTTEAAIAALEQGQIARLLETATFAARDRARENADNLSPGPEGQH